jgi:succinoglycan biosynthesis protein ExoA
VARLAAADPRIRLLTNPQRSTPVALNRALRHARGRWVARMDAHTEYPDDYLASGIERLSQGDTRWVSGPMVPVGSNPVSRAIALALSTPLGRGGSRRWNGGGPGEMQEYELDSGVFCGVWSRDALLEIGGWDEEWLRNQDSEMAGRFLGRGEKLICLPAMAARYMARTSIRGLWRQYLGYGEFRVKTAVRHPHTLRRSHLLAPGLVVVAASAVPRSKLRRLAAPILAAYAALLTVAAQKTLPDADHAVDSLLVPAVLATMHAGHGVGFWRGIRRYGLPVAGLTRMAGLADRAPSSQADSDPVFAPSLNPESPEPLNDSLRA